MKVEKIEAQYVVDGNAAPLLISNDVGVKLYIEVTKSVSDFKMYPLIITTIDKDETEMLFESETGPVMCLENSCKEVAELIGDTFDCSDPLFLCDVKLNKIISDCNNNEVKVGQFYKDKKTLIYVMVRYAIEYSFNFKAKIFDKKRYVSYFNYQNQLCVSCFLFMYLPISLCICYVKMYLTNIIFCYL